VAGPDAADWERDLLQVPSSIRRGELDFVLYAPLEVLAEAHHRVVHIGFDKTWLALLMPKAGPVAVNSSDRLAGNRSDGGETMIRDPRQSVKPADSAVSRRRGLNRWQVDIMP
jgi:hypothetical protein